RLCLEGFQAGISWSIVLRKRAALREAFAGFDPEAVASFGRRDIARLLRDQALIRNRMKIEAAVTNARVVSAIRDDGVALAELVWSFAPAPRRAPKTWKTVPALTKESTALAKELKHRGFRFVGPTTAYATMQAAGLVNDHLASCSVRDEVEREQAVARRKFPN
ncbi:MAG: DNA-3-methyladenine glycosylase I, partial [Actinomycetota bacterium]